MRYFVTGLTNADPRITAPVYKQYRYVQYLDALRPLETASVSFASSADTFRYVVIQKQFDGNGAFCMTEVKVYLRGKYAFYYYRSCSRCLSNVSHMT